MSSPVSLKNLREGIESVHLSPKEKLDLLRKFIEAQPENYPVIPVCWALQEILKILQANNHKYHRSIGLISFILEDLKKREAQKNTLKRKLKDLESEFNTKRQKCHHSR